MAVEISDWNDLDSIRNDLTGDYILVNDIDSSSAGYDTHGSSNANGGSGWNPINNFEGTLDGDGYEVRDLYISRGSTSGVGFMGSGSTNTSIVKNLGIVNADVTGSDWVGVIAGDARSEFTDCYCTGTVSSNNGKAGGFVGRAYGGSITRGYTTASVSGDGGDTGGFIGESQITISQSYSAGTVTGVNTLSVGGFVGQNAFGTVNDCYWDTESSGQSTGEAGTGLTTSEMQGLEAESNMTGFDFTNNWTAVDSANSRYGSDGYPILNALKKENQVQAQGINYSYPQGLFVWTGSIWKKVAGV